MTLYEIDRKIEVAMEAGMTVDEETGEVIFDESLLEGLRIEKNTKIESIALYIKSLLALAQDVKDEADALTERRKQYEKKAERLKEYLGQSLDCDGMDKFETAKCRISFRNSAAVSVDIDRLPEQYIRVKTAREPDKTAIGKAIKAGEEIPGAYIEERRSVIVK